MRNQVVSIIVPVYNVKEYLDTCLRSVIEQTYDKLEIVIVDDGSTDGSGKRCDEWMRLDSRIKVVHKDNEGLNMARKTGLDNSTGSWVIFVDSDDALHRQAVGIVMSAAKSAESDFVIGGYRHFSTDQDISVDEVIKKPKIVREDNLDTIIRWLVRDSPPYENILMQTAWMKLYSREILEAVDWEYADYRANEDEFMAIQYYPNLTKGVAVVPENLYFYRVNNNSITRKRFKNEFNGRNLSKFATLEDLYLKSLQKLDKKYKKEILLRFVVLYIGYTERFMTDGYIDKSMFDDFEIYFKPKIKQIEAICNELSEWHKTRFLVAKEHGIQGLLILNARQTNDNIARLEEAILTKEAETDRLRSEVKYLSSTRGVAGVVLGKTKRLVVKMVKKVT